MKALRHIIAALTLSMAAATTHAAYLPARETEAKPATQAALATPPATAAVATEDAALTNAVAEGMKSFNALSRGERKARIREAREKIRGFRHARGGFAPDDKADNDILYAIIAIFIPPLGVALHEQGVNSKFWISLLLTILFYVPGLIYSLIVILKD